MPRVTTQVKSKRGKDIKCGKCGTPILAGDKYKKFSKRTGFGRISGVTYYRCMKPACAPSGSELASGRTAELLALQEQLADHVSAFRSDEDVDGLVSNIDSLISDAESLKDDMQSGFDNMPEGLQQGDTGQLIEQRVEALDQFIDELNTAKDNADGALDDFEEPEEPEAPSESGGGNPLAMADYERAVAEHQKALEEYETEREEYETERADKINEIADEFDAISLEC